MLIMPLVHFWDFFDVLLYRGEIRAVMVSPNIVQTVELVRTDGGSDVTASRLRGKLCGSEIVSDSDDIIGRHRNEAV